MAKFELLFFLKLEDAFSQSFILTPTERAKISLKKDTRDFQNNPLFERSACSYVAVTGNFVKNEKLFQKTGVEFFNRKH